MQKKVKMHAVKTNSSDSTIVHRFDPVFNILLSIHLGTQETPLLGQSFKFTCNIQEQAWP